MEKQKINEDEIISYYNKYKDFLKESPSEYIRFFFKLDDKTITIYKNGTLFIQEKNLDNSDINKNDYFYDMVDTIGADEVGTGDTFGPIVCASVFVPKNKVDELVKLGVKDSKKISDDKILELGSFIKNNYLYKASLISNETYNKISSDYNLNVMKARLHNLNIFNLTRIVKYDKICLDEFVNKDKYYSYLNKDIVYDISFEQKGESKSIAVAASSILARFIFIEEIKKLEEKYNIRIPKGSSTDAQALVEKLKNENPDLLLKIAKCNFKNIQK